MQTRTTNEANEITTTTGLATPAYDRAGNMIVTPKPGDPANAWDVKYDAWNRVVEVTDGVTTVTYEYDANGRRIQRTAGVTEEHFYYDGDQVVEIREPDGLGGLQPKTQYVWSLQYVDSPVLRDSFSSGTIVTGDRLFYLTDANHNVTAVVDVDGDVAERYDYDPYGRATVYDAAWANPAGVSVVGNTLLFAGQDADAVTGLQYARARWYSSSIGGFLSVDPSGYSAGDMNLYRYVSSNPIIFVDPTGLYGTGSRMAAAGAAGAASGFITGSVAGPEGAALGAVFGGVSGAIVGAMMSSKASLEQLALAGAGIGILGGAAAAAGVSALGAAAGRAAVAGGGGAAGAPAATSGLSAAQSEIMVAQRLAVNTEETIRVLQVERAILMRSAPKNAIEAGGYAEYIAARVANIGENIAENQQIVDLMHLIIDLYLPG